MEAKVVRAEGGVIAHIPLEQVHALRIALQPCSCKAAKSNMTADTRARFERALATALFKTPSGGGRT